MAEAGERKLDVVALLDKVTPLNLTLLLGVASFGVIWFGTCAAFSTDGPLPPPRKPPPKPETSAVTTYRFKKGFYRAQVEEDCKRLKVRKIGLETIKQANPYAVEFSGQQTLRPGKAGGLDTSSVDVKLITRKLWFGEEGRGMRAPHLVLRIKNKTTSHIAYKIETELKSPCADKAVIEHNAIALEPKGVAERTECLVRKAKSLKVRSVEVMELTPIGYHYVSRLDPLRLGFPSRTADGHKYTKMPTCKLIPWRLIVDGMKTGDVRWYDVVDFYSRHNCDEYTFFGGYKWSAKGLSKLPATKRKTR